MFEILSVEEMKKADVGAIADGIAGLSLIETAGTALAHNILNSFEKQNVLFLCGSGNNGADGFAAAHVLKKNGWAVRLACLVKKTALKNDAALAAQKWDGDVENLNSNLSLKETGLVVDAVFGTGFNGALDPEIITLFDKIRAKKITVVAADIPSGMNATTGAIAAGTLHADMTVTFCRKKIAHVLQPSRKFCGKIYLAEIGIRDDIIAGLETSLFENNPALWLKDFPIPDVENNKFDRGHVVVYGGAKRTGAACLAAQAAQKIGAGLVTITSKPESRVIYSSCRASIMVDEWATLEDFKSILRDERKNTLVLGPGGGDSLKDIVDAALGFNKSAVLDADVFTAYKDSPQELFSKLSPHHHVLTPHEGEFERLFGKIKGSKLDRARSAAKLANAIILLKGSDTVIAAPDGTAIINTNAPPTLATGGSGDVLAGLIAGLMAQKMPPFMAASAACWLHAETARIHGLGLTAEDIIYRIIQALNSLFTIQKGDA